MLGVEEHGVETKKIWCVGGLRVHVCACVRLDNSRGAKIDGISVIVN